MFAQREENFSYDECNFNIQKSKESTARVVMSRINIQNAYTLECSFCGPTSGRYMDWHFTPPVYKNMGKEFWINLLQFYEEKKIVKEVYSIILEQFEQEQALLESKLEEEKKNSSGKNSKGKGDDSSKASEMSGGTGNSSKRK